MGGKAWSESWQPEGRYDLILLDIMLPGMNGFEVLQQYPLQTEHAGNYIDRSESRGWRASSGLKRGQTISWQNPAILENCLRESVQFFAGRKTPSTNEMMPAAERMVLGDIELDAGTRVVRRNGEELQLTSVEFNFLEILFRAAGHIVTREQLAQSALGRYLGAYDRSVDTHVSRLRKKLGHKYNEIERIKTIRGVGFVYTIPI